MAGRINIPLDAITSRLKYVSSSFSFKFPVEPHLSPY